jgi:putative transposase
LVWHITHRCHARSFLLRFRKDRRRWRHWLFEARRRYGFSVLNYIATSNHVHLLVFDNGNGEIFKSMQLAAGRTAQEYNQRKRRKGAFWEDRYHATAVEANSHLMRCMTYIDLNMVRAGAVNHPYEWDISGYAEIQAPWKRKAVIDYARLCSLLNAQSVGCLADTLRSAAESQLQQSVRQPAWTETIGVGSEHFIGELKRAIGPAAMHRKLTASENLLSLNDEFPTYLPKTGAKSAN